MSLTITDLNTLIAFNDQLAALFDAGVPVGFVGDSQTLDSELERINALLARRISQGESLDQALELERDVPSWYRSLALSAIKSGDVESALSDFTGFAQVTDQSEYVVESALIYPLIVVGLAYFGLIAFCIFFVPSLQSTYARFRIPVGSGIAVLEFLRDWLPFWIALPPIVLLLILARKIRNRRLKSASRRRFGGVLTRLSGATRALALERSAYVAKSIAAFDESGLPPNEAIELALGDYQGARAPEGTRPAAYARLPVAPEERTTGQRNHFPPFLQWALFESEPTIARHRALDMAAALYHQASVHAMQRARVFAPMVLIVVIGGTATLLYGLALFVPVVQMLKAIALTPVTGA